ncbi:ribonuclease P protein component [Flagellimonas marina]|uniref:Ribonuclease P protein component n=1 Tax=Flagellimonas marina TaxID=1775168 RepID=A0ABV8PNP3_9FLAO
MKNKIIPYNPKLKEFARQLRKNSTLSEVLLWQKIKQRALGVQFHRQVPLLEYIVDFYCHELRLAIEIDGKSHAYTYNEDAFREGQLDRFGVQVIRFSNEEIKNNLFSVLLTLQETVDKLHQDKSTHALNKTPLRSPQGDSSTSPFTFPKKEKLKSKTLFESLFKEGMSVSHFPLKLIYLNTSFEDDSKIKVGVVAPKKKFKSAVDRNRIKRLLREAYRLNKSLIFNNIEGNFAFLFLYLGNKMPSYVDIESAMQKLMEDFLKKESHEKID